VSRNVIGGIAASALLFLAACDGGPAAPPPSPPPPASRPAGDQAAPQTSAVVVREGDHLLVIVDVAPRDGRGRKVATAVLEAGGPATRAQAGKGAGPLALEARVPAGTNEVRISGTSEDGAAWSAVVSTKLE
jgi:hypothetical protein